MGGLFKPFSLISIFHLVKDAKMPCYFSPQSHPVNGKLDTVAPNNNPAKTLQGLPVLKQVKGSNTRT